MVVDRFGKNGETLYKVKARRRPPIYLRSSEQLRKYQLGGQMDYSRMARKLREKIAGFSVIQIPACLTCRLVKLKIRYIVNLFMSNNKLRKELYEETSS